MSQNEFNPCPECKVGRLMLTGRTGVTPDPQSHNVTKYREYKCDNCGHIVKGYDKVLIINETLFITDSPRSTEDERNRNNNNNNSGGGGGHGNGDGGVGAPFYNELNDRVHFKLNAARRHLDNLIRLETE